MISSVKGPWRFFVELEVVSRDDLSIRMKGIAYAYLRTVITVQGSVLGAVLDFAEASPRFCNRRPKSLPERNPRQRRPQAPRRGMKFARKKRDDDCN